MSRLVRWLRADLGTIGSAEHGFVVRRHHAIVVTGIIIAAILVFALGVFAGSSYPYKTVPAPPTPPGQTTPNCSVKPSKTHRAAKHLGMGSCLPQPTVHTQASITATTQGPDLSNNDPVSCSQMIQIAAHNAFVELKVNQGNYYTDRTAAGMASCAKAHHLAVGGYDFLDVCHQSPQAEADLYVADARADGLVTGPGVLPPDADAEYPLGQLSCNARDYITAWIYEVHRLTGRWAMMYTGAWWSDPHLGCWWPGFSISWISGYTSTANLLARYMPCGLRHLDIHQFTDAGWNGATTSDLSIWRAGVAAFNQATNQPTGPSPETVRRWIAIRGASLHAYYKHGCRQPVLTSGTCGQLAWRVDHFQKLVDTAHGYYPRCYGRSRNLGAAECQVVRSATATWSRARDSSHKAFKRRGCIPPVQNQGLQSSKACALFDRETLYFQGRINHTLGTSRF